MADLPTLLRRLSEVLAKPVNSSAEAVSDAIRVNMLGPVLCARDPMPDGKHKTFEAYFTAVFGTNLDGSVVKERKK